jgi:hypothetical protein
MLHIITYAVSAPRPADERRVERRLAAILAVDVAGYSRLMGEDEEGTLAALRAVRRGGRPCPAGVGDRSVLRAGRSHGRLVPGAAAAAHRKPLPFTKNSTPMSPASAVGWASSSELAEPDVGGGR